MVSWGSNVRLLQSFSPAVSRIVQLDGVDAKSENQLKYIISKIQLVNESTTNSGRPYLTARLKRATSCGVDISSSSVGATGSHPRRTYGGNEGLLPGSTS